MFKSVKRREILPLWQFCDERTDRPTGGKTDAPTGGRTGGRTDGLKSGLKITSHMTKLQVAATHFHIPRFSISPLAEQKRRNPFSRYYETLLMKRLMIKTTILTRNQLGWYRYHVLCVSFNPNFQSFNCATGRLTSSLRHRIVLAETVMLKPSIWHHNFFLTFKWLNFLLIYLIIPHSFAGYTVIMIIFFLPTWNLQ